MSNSTPHNWLIERTACSPAMWWVEKQPVQTPRALVQSCEDGAWMLWLWECFRWQNRQPALEVVQRQMLRVLRGHLPAALDAAGFSVEADELRSLPDNVRWSIAHRQVHGIFYAALDSSRDRDIERQFAIDMLIATLDVLYKTPQNGFGTYMPVIDSTEPHVFHRTRAEDLRLCADDVRRLMGEDLIRVWEDALSK